jgi:hypothetical protein
MFGKNKINKMGIQDSIRRNIQILQEEKKVSLTEEKIVKGRFSMVPKNINKHSTIQNNKTFNVLFNEVRTLKSHGINQKVIKEKLAEYLKSKLQLTDIEQEILVSAIGNTEMDEVSELFNDPRFLAQKISQAYSEDMGSKYSMVSTDNSDMVKKLEDTFVDKLKPVIGDVNSKMELKLKDIRDNMLS